MTGPLFAFLFAAGVGLFWAGAVCHARPANLAQLVRDRLGKAELPVSAPLFLGILVVATLASGAAAWWLIGIPILTILSALAGAYLPLAWARNRREQRRRERERAWPATLAQLADALEAGLGFPAAIALASTAGPQALRPDLAAFHQQLRSGGLAHALDGLVTAGERTADTVAVFLRTGLLELPAGGLAPVLRELSHVLSDRLEGREKARTRAASLQLEAAILALSPILLLLLVGAASPGYLDAYKTAAGTAVSALCGLLIFGCYLLMRRLGRVPEPRRTQTTP